MNYSIFKTLTIHLRCSRLLVSFALSSVGLIGCTTESSPPTPQLSSYQANITGTAVLASMEQLDSVRVTLSAPAMTDSTGLDGRFFFSFNEFKTDGVHDVTVTLSRRTCRDTMVTASYSSTTNTVHLGLIIMGLKP